VIVAAGVKENYFYIFGGRDERSQDLSQGVTLAGVYLDEVALMPQSFVNQATARCSVENSKMWFNCNPSHPSHWFKTEWIDKAEDKEILYLHFLMDDNLSLSEKVKERYKKQYTGVFYDRYIRGIWAFAEGVIYRAFADDMAGEKRMLISTVPQISKITIGVDFGGSSSAHTFVCTGTDRGYRHLYALASERVECTDSNGMQIDIDPEKLGQLFCDFVERVIMMYGVPDRVYCDSAEQTLILGLRATARKHGLGWLRIENALKTSINDRIRTVHRLMAQGRFFVVDHGCESLIKALQEAVWNPRAVTEDERLDDGTSDIDTLDAFEYTFERDISRYIKLE
jgi:PBSX family phage terminase large subunit